MSDQRKARLIKAKDIKEPENLDKKATGSEIERIRNQVKLVELERKVKSARAYREIRRMFDS